MFYHYNDDQNYVQISGEVLKPMCERAIENIFAARKKDDADDIVKHRRKKYIIFGRLETDAEVVARLSKPDGFGFTKYPSTRAYSVEATARALLRMLEKSKDNTVWVTQHDFDWLEHWAE